MQPLRESGVFEGENSPQPNQEILESQRNNKDEFETPIQIQNDDQLPKASLQINNQNLLKPSSQQQSRKSNYSLKQTPEENADKPPSAQQQSDQNFSLKQTPGENADKRPSAQQQSDQNFILFSNSNLQIMQQQQEEKVEPEQSVNKAAINSDEIQLDIQKKQFFQTGEEQIVQKNVSFHNEEIQSGNDEIEVQQRPSISQESDDEEQQVLKRDHEEGARKMEELRQFIQERSKKEPTNWERVGYQIFMFFFSFILLVLTTNSYIEYDSYQRKYLQITQNWKNDILIDIRIASPSEDCQETFGQEYFDVLNYQWQGSNDGCDCTRQFIVGNPSTNTTANPYPSFFRTGKTCSTDDQNKHCNSVHSLMNRSLYYWSDGAWGQPIRFCGKSLENYDFAYHAPQGKNCSENFKKCGSGDNFFCVPIIKNTPTTCPINYIGFRMPLQGGNDKWSQANFEDSNVTEKIQKVQALNNNGLNYDQNPEGHYDSSNQYFHFYYFREFLDYPPISEFRATEMLQDSDGSISVGVCLDDNTLGNIDPYRNDYFLMKKRRVPCTTDQRFQLTHSMNEYQYYLANNMLYLLQDLPLFVIDVEFQWGLFFRGYIQWNDSCRGEELNHIVEYGDKIQDIITVKKVQIALTIILFIIMGIIYSMVSCASAFGYRWSCLNYRNPAETKQILILEILSKFILETILLAIAAWTYDVSGKFKIYLQYAIDNNCSDSYTTSLFNDFMKILTSKSWSFNTAIVVLMVLGYVTEIIIAIFALRNHKKQEENDDGGMNLQKFRTMKDESAKQASSENKYITPTVRVQDSEEKKVEDNDENKTPIVLRREEEKEVLKPKSE